MIRAFFLIPLVTAFWWSLALAQDTTVAIPQISILPENGAWVVTGTVLGLADATLTASLTIERTGAGGKMKSQQGREIVVNDGSQDLIGRTSISADRHTVLYAVLSLYRDDEEVAVATSRVGELK